MSDLAVYEAEGAVAAYEPDQILPKLDAAGRFLEQACNDFERLYVRRFAQSVQAAYKIWERGGRAHVEASILIARAERAIAVANPVLPVAERVKLARECRDGLAKPRELPPGLEGHVLTRMRRAHRMHDDDFEAYVAEARRNAMPISSMALEAHGRALEAQRIGPESPAKQVLTFAAVLGDLDYESLTPEQVENWLQMAEFATLAAKHNDMDDVYGRLAAGRLRLRRRLGQLLPKQKTGPKGDDDGLFAGANKLSPPRRSELRKLAEVPEEDFEAAARKLAAGEKGIEKALLRGESNKQVRLQHNSGDPEWYTPGHIVEAARSALGGRITLDPASSDMAQETVRAERHFTVSDDGLAQDWSGEFVYLNPPYSSAEVTAFTAKAIEEPAQAVVLVPNSTETRWAAALMAAATAICFPRGRVKFISSAGRETGGALQGSMIVGLRVDAQRFTEAFEPLGGVWVHG